MINVAIVEDDRDFRTTLEGYLNEAQGYRCVCACDSAEDALKVIPKLLPDVVLMDIHLPGISGVACTQRLKELCPSLRVLILTVYEDSDQIFGALKAGANGYLLKRAEPAEILRAIQDVNLGGGPMSSLIACRVVESFHENLRPVRDGENLSRREEEILQYLSKGYSTKEIANQLSISAHTVHTHLQNIYKKLHVRSRTEAIVKFLK